MLRLPVPDHRPLRHVGLPLVVAQARFSSQVTDIEQDHLAQFQALLVQKGFPFPTVSTFETNQVVITPTAPSIQSSSGYQFASSDGQWTISLAKDSVALETPSFRSYSEDFGPRLRAMIEASDLVLRPLTASRLGLRFVNVLRIPAENGGRQWSRWLRASLVSPLEDAWLAEGLTSEVHQLVVELANGLRSGIRCGPVEADGFLLDLDTFVESESLWASDGVISEFDKLNSAGVALFQSLVTADMLEVLQGEKTPSEGTR